jgi:methionine synthase II (cobalamin-independent)
MVLSLGVVPGTDAVLSTVDSTADIARKLWNRLGFKPETLAQQVVLSPACGLAGASPDYVRQALTRCREAAKRLAEEPEPS